MAIRLNRNVSYFLALCFSLFLAVPCVLGADDAQRLLALVDYIGGDYNNAVKDGKVIDQDEYQEMKEFTANALQLFAQLKATEKVDKAGVEPILQQLEAQVQKHESEARVTELTQSIRQKLVAAYGIETFPKTTPALGAGRKVYTETCAQCHGESGKGDGPSRATMQPKEPAPANFNDSQVMANLSPFRAFNTATFGVPGTAMPNFSALTVSERWQVAFYVFSLRFPSDTAQEGKRLLESKKLPQELIGIESLSNLSDKELENRLQSYFPAQSDRWRALAYLRRGLLEENTADPLLRAKTLLSEALDLYEKGEKDQAYQKAVESYIDGFDLAEPALFARDLSFGRALEARFTQFRSSIKRGDPVAEVQRQKQVMDAELAHASQLLTRENSLSGWYLFLNAALIIVREGLEAALILAAILALLRVMGAKEAIRYVHLGWVLAVAAGLLMWILVQTVLTLSSSHREVMEGLITLGAALVLFYMGYWLHTKAEARKWQRFIQAKVNEALSGKGILALVGVSFFAVFREAFEVVLFYQALWLQSPSSPQLVIWGFVAGLGILAVLVWAIFKLGLRIPLKYFFGAAGALLYLLAFVFAGNGVKELQAAGWSSSTPLPFPPQMPWLGVYPTIETLAAQGLMVVALVATVLWSGRQREAAG
jgi:high-affinity iron transporter